MPPRLAPYSVKRTTMADATGRFAVARHLVERAGIEPVVAGLPPRLEASARGDLVTVINHAPETVEVSVPEGTEPFVLEPYGYRVMRGR